MISRLGQGILLSALLTAAPCCPLNAEEKPALKLFEMLSELSDEPENCDQHWNVIWSDREDSQNQAYSYLAVYAALGVHPFDQKDARTNIETAFKFAVIAGSKNQILSQASVENVYGPGKSDLYFYTIMLRQIFELAPSFSSEIPGIDAFSECIKIVNPNICSANYVELHKNHIGDFNLNIEKKLLYLKNSNLKIKCAE